MSRKLVIAAVLVIAAIGIGIFTLTRDSDSKSDQPPTEAKIPTVGLLVPSDLASVILQTQLTELGYIEGETIQYQLSLTADPADYEAAIQALIDSDVDVMVATGAPIALVASKLTTTIPIVFMGNQGQFTTDLEPIIRQQGADTNLTGVITTNPAEKRFELLMQTIPSIKVVYVPYDPSNALSAETIDLLEAAAPDYGVTLETFEFSDDAGGQQALESLPPTADAIMLNSEVPSLVRMTQWANLSIERKVPLIISLGQFSGNAFPSGILLGYGGGVQELYVQVADLVDQLLKGTSPADLPVRPSDVYLTVSMGAADALGIEIPDDVLDQATQILRDEVAVPTAVAAEATESVAEGSAACNATLNSPLGENHVCITKSCDQVADSGFASFTDKVGVDSCSTEEVLGICSTPSGDTYFYDGTIGPIETGCTSNGGEWKTSTE